MNDVLVPALGTMTLTGGYGRVPPEQAAPVLTYALESGIALLDTADAYPGGESLLASALATAPGHPVRIVTKVGLTGPPGRRLVCGHPTYLRRAGEVSLRRLGGEHLHALLLHRVDPTVPVEDSMEALMALVQEGKVAKIGICTDDPDVLRRATSCAPISFVQSELSVLEPTAATNLLPVAREIGATLLARSPLHRGLVTGGRKTMDFAADDARAYIPEMTAPARRSRAIEFRQLATELGVSVVDLALGWLTSLGPDVVPIPGARTQRQVAQLVSAQRRQLSVDNARALDAFVGTVGRESLSPEPYCPVPVSASRAGLTRGTGQEVARQDR